MLSMPPDHEQAAISGLDGLRCQHHRFQTGAAHLVDRGRTDRDWEPGEDGRLAGGRLPFAGRDHVAHDNFVNLRWIGDAGAFDGSFDGDGSQAGGRKAAQAALEPPAGSADGAQDNGFVGVGGHAGFSLKLVRKGGMPAMRPVALDQALFTQAWLTLRQVSSRDSGNTRVAPKEDMKLVSPTQRGTTWKCT